MQPHIKLLIIDMVNFNLSLLSEKDRKALIGDLQEQQRVLDAKEAEQKNPPKKKGKKNKKDGDDVSIIDAYL